MEVSGSKRPRAGMPGRIAAATMSLLSRIGLWFFDRMPSKSGLIDLADYPERYDLEKVATFCEACSEVFPGQRDIYLPSAMEERLLVSQPPVKSELLLIKRLRQVRPLILSIRALLGERAERYLPLETIHFYC